MHKIVYTMMAVALSSTAWAGSNFQTLDTNQDGYISPSEAADDAELSSQWSRIDANNDGRVDQAEFSALEIKDEPTDEPVISVPMD